MIPSGPFYYVDTEGQLRGPKSVPEIQALLAAGVLRPETNICTEGGQQWFPAGPLAGVTPASPPSWTRSGVLWLVGCLSGLTSLLLGVSLHLSLLVALVCVGFVVSARLLGPDNWAAAMHSYRRALAVIAALAGLVLVGWVVHWSNRVEYRIIFVPDHRSAQELGSFGREGWDIINVRRVVDGNTPGYEYHLRR